MPSSSNSSLRKQPKPRTKRRDPRNPSCLDIALQAHFSAGIGKKSRKVSASDILLAKLYERALAGDIRDLETMLKFHENNRDAIAWHYANCSIQQLDYECLKAMEASLILEIFGFDRDDKILRFVDLSSRTIPLEFHKALRLKYWVRWARQEERQRDWGDVGQIVKLHPSIAASYADRVDALTLREDDEDEIDKFRYARLQRQLRTRRESKGRFEPGECGNRNGRAGTKTKIDMPFPWLEEIVVIEVSSRPVEMTRCEALIFLLQTKGIKEPILGRKLGQLLGKLRVAQWRPRTQQEVEDERTVFIKQIPDNVYDLMRNLCLVSPRAKKSILIEPWLVEQALARLGRQLDPYEQTIVVNATSRPYGDFWPKWWIDRPDPGRPPRACPEIEPIAIIRI